MENALTRKQTLQGMTTWAAKANFEEKEKGQLETGKFADFVVLEDDLRTVDERKILQTRVLDTFVAGELVYEKK